MPNVWTASTLILKIEGKFWHKSIGVTSLALTQGLTCCIYRVGVSRALEQSPPHLQPLIQNCSLSLLKKMKHCVISSQCIGKCHVSWITMLLSWSASVSNIFAIYVTQAHWYFLWGLINIPMKSPEKLYFSWQYFKLWKNFYLVFVIFFFPFYVVKFQRRVGIFWREGKLGSYHTFLNSYELESETI